MITSNKSTCPINNNSNISAIDLTAMIDILFTLLVFLLLIIGTSIKSITVDLPSAVDAKSNEIKNQAIMIEITKNGYVFENVIIGNLQELESKLIQTLNQEKEYLIASDKDIALEKFIEVMTMMQSHKIKVANILIKNK